MKLNMIGLEITEEDRKKLGEGVYGVKKPATRAECREFFLKAITDACNAHGVTVTMPKGKDDETA